MPINDALDYTKLELEGEVRQPITSVYGIPVVLTDVTNEKVRKALRPFDNELIIPLVVARFTSKDKGKSYSDMQPVIYTTHCPVVKSHKSNTALPLHTKAVFVYSLFFLGAFQRLGGALRMNDADITERWGDDFNWFFHAWNPENSAYFNSRIQAANEAINQLYYWGWLKPFRDAYGIMQSLYTESLIQHEKNRLDAKAMSGYDEDTEENEKLDSAVYARMRLISQLEDYMDRLVNHQVYHVPMIEDKDRRDYLIRKNHPDVNFFKHIWLVNGDAMTEGKRSDFVYDSLRGYGDIEHTREAWMYYEFPVKKK